MYCDGIIENLGKVVDLGRMQILFEGQASRSGTFSWP